MMTMFGTLVQRLTSPVTSPTSPRRRFKSPSRWEVQSDPEDDPAAPVRKSRAKHLLDKRKSKSRARGLHSSQSDHLQICNGGGGWHDVVFPPLRGTKSLGRLDGMKEVSLQRALQLCPPLLSDTRRTWTRSEFHSDNFKEINFHTIQIINILLVSNIFNSLYMYKYSR